MKTCTRCSESKALDEFPRNKRKKAHDIGNLQPLCNLCNVRKNAAWPLTPERLKSIRESVLGTTSPTPGRG